MWAMRGLVLMAGIVLAAPAAAQIKAPPFTVSHYTFTPKRIVASSGVVIGLIGAVIGGLAVARSARRAGPGNPRRGAMLALILGPIAAIVGGVVVATAKGGLGTGNGLAGGVVAIAMGAIGMLLGAFALGRRRRVT